MSPLFLIIAIAVLLLVCWWYVANEVTGAGGADGILAVKTDETEARKKKTGRRYRARKRAAPARRDREPSKKESGTGSAYRVKARKTPPRQER